MSNTDDELDKNPWLKPSDIAKRSLIRNSVGKGDYRYVIRLIKSNKLKARNWAMTGDKPYWLVHTDEITRYNKELINGQR